MVNVLSNAPLISSVKNLITGGAGFIGSHLTERILNTTEEEVVIYDNFSSGTGENISHLQDYPRLEEVEGDILDEKNLATYAAEADRIYHLAALAGVGNVVSDPVKTLRVNSDGTRNVLAVAAKDNTPTFIPSSSDVYGKSPAVPFTEDGDRLDGTYQSR